MLKLAATLTMMTLSSVSFAANQVYTGTCKQVMVHQFSRTIDARFEISRRDKHLMMATFTKGQPGAADAEVQTLNMTGMKSFGAVDDYQSAIRFRTADGSQDMKIVDAKFKKDHQLKIEFSSGPFGAMITGRYEWGECRLTLQQNPTAETEQQLENPDGPARVSTPPAAIPAGSEVGGG